jgi:hypothetical protein
MKITDITYRTLLVRYDPLAQIEIFERRNSATGEVTFQTPSPQVVKELQTVAPAAPTADTAVGTTAKSAASVPRRVSLVV